MRLATVVILSLLLAFLVFEIRSFSLRGGEVRKEYERFRAELQRAESDARALRSDFAYYSNPANLEKELRARFNYRTIGERLIVIVPLLSSTSSSTP